MCVICNSKIFDFTLSMLRYQNNYYSFQAIQVCSNYTLIYVKLHIYVCNLVFRVKITHCIAQQDKFIQLNV